MIDTAVILFSLGMVAFIVVRATILDRKLPWFPPPSEADPSASEPGTSGPGTSGPGTSAPAGVRRGHGRGPGGPAPGPTPGSRPGQTPRRARPRRVSQASP